MTKFKVGDKVKRIEDTSYWTDVTGLNGTIVTIDKIFDNYGTEMLFLDGVNNNDGCGWIARKFELVSSKEKKYEWNKGDKLEVIASIPHCIIYDMGIRDGDIVISNQSVFSNDENYSIEVFSEDKNQKDIFICKVYRLKKISSIELNKLGGNMTKKTVFNVLVVNKKTGNIEKDVNVVAEEERQAILKAYKIDVEKLSFTVTERTTYEEQKPQTVILEKEVK